MDNNYNEETHTLKLFYIDSKGQTASSSLEELESLLPSVKLSAENIIVDGKPNWSEIDTIASEYLEAIKLDLNYKQ